MAYTEFRKSYGDFEIVITPVDFSCLTEVEARLTVNALQKYEAGFVCHVLGRHRLYKAKDCINSVLKACYSYSTIEGAVNAVQPWLYDEGYCYPLSSNTPPGIVFRKAWVKHLISDIMREHGLETID